MALNVLGNYAVLCTLLAQNLTDRLRMLEEQGIVTRTLYPGVPLHVEYELTERGQRLQPIFAAMSVWAQENICQKKCYERAANVTSQQ